MHLSLTEVVDVVVDVDAEDEKVTAAEVKRMPPQKEGKVTAIEAASLCSYCARVFRG